jgi:hypothetical protein
MLDYKPPLEVLMEEKNLDYTGAEVKEIQIDEEFAAEQARKKQIRETWDKITTGLFIALLASPFIILLYIFLWFVSVS